MKENSKIKSHIIMFISLQLIWFVPDACGQTQELYQNNNASIDWDIVLIEFQRFLNHPCQKETKLFLATLPNDKAKLEIGDKENFLHLLAGWEYHILSNEIRLGNRPAVEAAFRLLNILEPQSQAEICIDLSHLIRINPQLFLELAHKYKDSYFIRREGFPVSLFIPAYEQRLMARIYELEMRMRALGQINIDEIEETKVACLEVLNSNLEILRTNPKVRNILNKSSKYRILKKDVSKIDKGSIEKASEAFIEYPSLDNAKDLRDSFPKAPEIPRIAFTPIDLQGDYWILDYEALTGNRFAAEVICRLINYADGIAGQQYYSTLGQLIRTNPRLFLQIIKDNEELSLASESSRGYGIEYNYFEGAIMCIYEARIQALQSVDDPDLLEIRNACISYLQQSK